MVLRPSLQRAFSLSQSGWANDFAVSFDEPIYTLSCERHESVLIEVAE